jgi:lipoprotein-anchoring transpeptidase ErfK/SrfK
MTVSLRRTTSALALLLLLGVSGCGMDAADDKPGADQSATFGSAPPTAPASSPASPSPTRTRRPAGPRVTISSIAPVDGQEVGVAMPISVVFASGVPDDQRKAVEQAMDVTSSTPVTGAWHWFSERRVDFRAKGFWQSGTTVTLTTHFGRATDKRTFTIGDDVRTHVYVAQHKTVVTKDGRTIKTMPSDAGSPSWPTWTGTMAVVNKEPVVEMDSCSVHIACNPSDPNYYKLKLPWDVRLTWSGTFLHYSPADPSPGHANGSHGCVHLSFADAKWYYELSKTGDPVIVTGSSRPKADADNGYAAFNLSWAEWLKGSATGAFSTKA